MVRVLMLAAVLLAPAGVRGQDVSPKHPFLVFEATNFTQKPDLTRYGVKRIAVVYPPTCGIRRTKQIYQTKTG